MVIDSEQCEKCGHKIDGADEAGDALSGEFLIGVFYNQRNVSDATIEKLRSFLYAAFFAEMCAVVGGEYDDCIVGQAELLDSFEESANAVIAECYFRCIEVSYDGKVIGTDAFVPDSVSK